MSKTRQIETIARLTSEHPEVAVELLDHRGNIRIILFNGMSHPECLPTGGNRELTEDVDPVEAVETANIYPMELYQDATMTDMEPIAKQVSLDEAIRAIEAD